MNLDSLIAEKIFNTKEQQKHNHTHIKEIKKSNKHESAMKYYLLVTNRCARKGACEQAVIYLCLFKKKCYETYKQQPQSLHLICHQVPDTAKTFKVLIALLFLTYAKKGALLFFYSLEEVCNSLFIFVCTQAFLK